MLTGLQLAALASPIRITGDAECTILIRICLAAATGGVLLHMSSVCAGCARFRVSFFAPDGAFGAGEETLALLPSAWRVGFVAMGVESEPYALVGVVLSARAGMVESLKLSLHSLDEVDSVRDLWLLK